MFKLDPEATFGFLMNDVSRLMRAYFDRRAQELGLTRAQWRVLVHLAPREGINQSTLAEILEVDAVTLGRHLDRLQRDGWIERRPDPEDRRAWRLFVTEALQPTLDSMAELALGTHAAALGGLSAEEQAQLIAMLSRIKANLSERKVRRPATPGLDTAPPANPGAANWTDGVDATPPARPRRTATL